MPVRRINRSGWLSAGVSAAGMVLLVAGCATPMAPGPFVINEAGERVVVAPFAVINGEHAEVPEIPMGNPATINRILYEGMHRNRVMDHLTHLTKNIGHRLTGSTNCEVANVWAADRFRAWGLQNVELAEWGTVAVRFDRMPSWGKGFAAGSEEPDREFQFSTSAWVIGTNGPVRAPVIVMPTSLEELMSNEGSYAGAWVVIDPQTGRQGAQGGGVRRGGMGVRDGRRREARERLERGEWPDIGLPGQPSTLVERHVEKWSGDWQGTTSGMGQSLGVILKISQSPEGVWTGTMDIPDNGASNEITNVVIEGETLTFQWASPAEVHSIRLTQQADGTLAGETTYMDVPFEIQLSRASAAEVSEPDPGNVEDYILQAVLAENPAGFISSSGDFRVWTGAVSGWRERPIEQYGRDFEISVTQDDFAWIRERVGTGVRVEFNLDHRLTPGPIPVYNTIAEIPGVDPNLRHEVVIVSAHLDSWNGPGSEGCVDNGTGSSVVLESARLLMAARAQPKRTIRFILWTGEEQGLLGSRAYVEQLGDDLANVSAVFVDDGGTNYQGGLHAIESMRDYLAAATAPVNGRFYSEEDGKWMNVNVRIERSMPAGGGSDHASFNRVGVPGFFWDEVGRANYQYAWHTQFDRLDQAIPEYLYQSATCMAITAYNLACAPELLPRQAPRAQGDRPGGGQGPPQRRPAGAGAGNQ
ncbi:MAG: M20/M25/M40 family metallo-hydrolase [Phycisphaeraceae bacterium]|nr:M20/M25/M40 family metallo-hydrolase [Phycisphaeraceae bacterium]